MSLKPEYYRYLQHFGSTVPVSQLYYYPHEPGLCALRHDVDHDLDVALEMAYWEHELGIRSTYYVLPTAPYWNEPNLIEKCLQLQDYKHEVGLHVNCLAQWIAYETDDPENILQNQLACLRDGGLNIIGMSAHGDKQCYSNNFSNYWCFKELKPVDPFSEEDGRTAEGPFEANGVRRLVYPKSHEIVRSDGASESLWSISMASLGLEYHAWHTPFDQYFSDSGGGWKRTSDPFDFKRSQERWQVLMHPIHWRGPQRIYFFLSTARSGSRWLSEVLKQGTSLEARHEYILNQEFHHGQTAHKLTADFNVLEENPDLVDACLMQAWEEMDESDGDYAEVNVYLETFVDKLRNYFPEAAFIHLYRNPASVVSSLMNRDWYDTPDDPNHPALHQVDSRQMTQFERVCQYVTETNSRLMNACNLQLCLEEIVGDPTLIGDKLKDIGIAYHPRLGKKVFEQVINATQQSKFSKPENWSLGNKRAFVKFCGEHYKALGYKYEFLGISDSKNTTNSDLKQKDSLFSIFPKWTKQTDKDNTKKIASKVILSTGPSSNKINKIHYVECDHFFDKSLKSLVVNPRCKERNAYIALGGSSWHRTLPILRYIKIPVIGRLILKNRRTGWENLSGSYVSGRIEAEVNSKYGISVFGISYNSDGKQIHRRRLGALVSSRKYVDFAFTPKPGTYTFDVILHIPMSDDKTQIRIAHWQLERKY